MKAEKIYDETFTARNFNTSPLTIGVSDEDTVSLSGASHLTVADDATLEFGSSNFAIEFRFNYGGTVDNRYFACKEHSSTTSDRSWHIQLNSTLLRFAYSTDGTNFTNLDSTGISWSTNTWYHVVIQRVGSNILFYVDNVLKDTIAISGTLYNSTGELVIGRLNQYGSLLFNGNVTTFRVASSTELTTGDIGRLYNNGVGIQWDVLGSTLQSKFDMSLPLNDGDPSPYNDKTANANNATQVSSPTITTPTLSMQSTSTIIAGDSYDYEIIIQFTPLVTTLESLILYANADKTANYRSYYMWGTSTSATAGTNDSAGSWTSVGVSQTNSQVSLFKGRITGSSGDERYLDNIMPYETGSNPSIIKRSSYWKNTADELTSLLIESGQSTNKDAHIIIYRTPKAASQSSWELIKKGSVNQNINTTPFDISGLDGDSDITYRLSIRNMGNSSTSGHMYMRLNADGGTNYNAQWLRNVSGSISATNYSTFWQGLYIDDSTSTRTDIDYIIHAESGVDRLVEEVQTTITGGDDQLIKSVWWKNTGDNLTSLRFTKTASDTTTFDYKLYRLKNPNGPTGDTLPFETVKVVDISGDFSAGHTFSGLTGDDYKMIKIEWLGSNTSSAHVLRMQINGDTGSNYTEQRLRGNSSTASAASTTQTYFDYCWIHNGDMSTSEMYLYPQSGENRPALSKFALDEDQVDLRGAWWLNSADEITSIKIYGSNTNSLTGTLKLSILR